MSSIFEEALLEAKKLRQVAEEDAKNTLIQEMTPAIRKIIASQLAGKSNMLFEEELPGTDPAAPVTPEPEVSADPTGDASMPAPVSPEPPASGQGAAPIKVAGAEVMNMPMPGPDGKLVIDLDDLFVPAEPGSETPDEGSGSAEAPAEIPGGMPSPTPVDVNPSGSAEPSVDGEALPSAGQEMVPPAPPPAEEAPPAEEPTMEETYELFTEKLGKTASQIHQAYSSKVGVPSLVKEALQERLFQLLESLETLNSKNLISPRLNQIQETRLEILHRKLKEAVVANTYHRTEEGTGTDMASKSLKEMAAKLLAESDSVQGGPVTSPADVHKTEVSMKVDNSNDAAADKAGSHAMKVTEPTVTLKTESAEAQAQAALAEELAALVAEGSGDSLAAKDGEQALAGAASTIPDSKVGQVDPTKSTDASKTNPASHVQGVSESKKDEKPMKKESVAVSSKALAEQTKKIKAEALKKQIAALQEQLKECGMPMEGGDALPTPGAPGMGVMSEDEGTVINFNFDLADLVPELSGLGDDDEIEVVDDMPSSDEPSSLGVGSADAGADEGDDVDLDLDGDDDEPEDKGPLAESKKRPVTAKIVKENKELRSSLADQKLFNAKLVHFQPFVNNRNLTKEQKQKIAEHLDRGTSLEEVKAIYNRVKVVVEGMQKVSSKTGSSSKAGVTAAAPLNESANPYEGATLVEAEKNRLMQLAGIKRK